MPGRHGPTGPCGCCQGDCQLGSDDFNRANANRPGGEFVLLSGTGEILDNQLVVDGIVATTICHPPVYNLGSFIARFEIVDPEDGDEVIVTGGNPTDPKMTVTYTFAGVPGAGTVKVEIDTKSDEDVDEGSYPDTIFLVWPEADVYEGIVCYGPSLAGSAAFLADGSELTPRSDVCMDENDTSPCWYNKTDIDTNTVDVGNFAFVKGTFDNWTYFVHFVDFTECEWCTCFCRRLVSDNVWDEACVPTSVFVTLGSDSDCPGIEGTYELFQRFRNDGPEDAEPDVNAFQQKFSWVSDPIGCPPDSDLQFLLELRCDGISKGDTTDIPNFDMYCVTFKTDGTARNSNFGFDAADPDTVQAASASANDNVSIATCKSGTCDPLTLNFPDIVEDSYSGGDETDSCCGGYVNSGGAYEPEIRLSVTVTL